MWKYVRDTYYDGYVTEKAETDFYVLDLEECVDYINILETKLLSLGIDIEKIQKENLV
jgi:hypothetical protein